MVSPDLGWMVVTAVFAVRMAIAKLESSRIFGPRPHF